MKCLDLLSTANPHVYRHCIAAIYYCSEILLYIFKGYAILWTVLRAEETQRSIFVCPKRENLAKCGNPHSYTYTLCLLQDNSGFNFFWQ